MFRSHAMSLDGFSLPAGVGSSPHTTDISQLCLNVTADDWQEDRLGVKGLDTLENDQVLSEGLRQIMQLHNRAKHR